MNRIVPLVVLMALAGCSAQPDNAPQDGSSTSEPAPPAGTANERQTPPGNTAPPPDGTPPATGTPAPPTTPPVATGIPERFQGTYAVDANACGQAGHESRLILSDDRIQFHESSGTVTQGATEADTLRVTADMTGEGETRQATYRFALAADGSQLRDLDHGMVRVRCP